MVGGGWSGLQATVDYITKSEGGRGAVREISELVLKVQNKWRDVVGRYFERI
jgi:3-deoxy-D-manno-octulosonate 8-phosphate phosphatase (KDO 8-P phosphatase)